MAPRTIERAFCVLESFTVDAERWRTTDLAHHCELPVPTVHRILGVLERFGYVTRDPATREYRLGPTAAGLLRGAASPAELRRLALPILGAVRRAAGETVQLSTLSESRDRGVEIAYLDGDARFDACERVEPGGSRGRSGPLHAGASFKVLLAQMPRDELERVMRRRLELVGPGTITQPSRLRSELAAIRRRGWAFSREETAPGSWAVAVRVCAWSSSTSCALAIAAPLDQLDAERARRHLSLLGIAAGELARRLSGAAPGGELRANEAAA